MEETERGILLYGKYEQAVLEGNMPQMAAENED